MGNALVVQNHTSSALKCCLSLHGSLLVVVVDKNNCQLKVNCRLLCCSCHIRLVKRPLQLHNLEVLFSGSQLVTLSTVSRSEDCCTILLALTTEVRHWLHYDDSQGQHLPETAKGGVCCCTDIGCGCLLSGLVIHPPDPSL